MPSDTELLQCYAEERLEPAFAELVARYLDLVYSTALRRVGDPHRAQDVAQIVFTTLARKARTLTRHPVLAGWLYTATQHTAAKVIRTESRRRVREREAHIMHEMLSSDDVAIDWERVRPVLDDAMRELGDADREAVLLRFFARRPFAEIGAALRLSEDAARMRVERALAKLRHALARRGVTSTVAALSSGLLQHATMAAPGGLVAQVTSAAITASAAEAFNLLTFMSTAKFIGTSAAALALLSVGTVYYESRVEQSAQAALATARDEHAAEAARLRAIEQRLHATQQELEQLQQAVAEARAAATAAEAQRNARSRANIAASAEKTEKDPVTVGNEFLARFPDVRQALIDRSLARIRGRFEPLYAELRLTREQIEKFENLMLSGEGLTTSRAGGEGLAEVGPLDLRPAERRTRGEMEQALRELLGNDGFQKVNDAANRAAQQQFTVQLAEALYFTPEPLTGQQAQALGPVLAQFPIRRGDIATRDWDGLLAAARPLLTDTQLAALGRIRVQEEFGVTMKSRMFETPRP